MIVVCIKEGYLFFDKYAKLYFGFVFFYLVACFSTGGFDIALRNLLSYYLVAFSSCTYNGPSNSLLSIKISLSVPLNNAH